MSKHPTPKHALDIPAHSGSAYPAPFASEVAGRIKRKLGDAFGLDRFGINLTELPPGSASALAHHHQRQDEFVYVLEGTLTLRLGEQEYTLKAGDCIGFPRATGVAHQLVNCSDAPARYLEVGDRTAEDRVEYPHRDLLAVSDAQGRWRFLHRDGRPWENDQEPVAS